MGPGGPRVVLPGVQGGTRGPCGYKGGTRCYGVGPLGVHHVCAHAVPPRSRPRGAPAAWTRKNDASKASKLRHDSRCTVRSLEWFVWLARFTHAAALRALYHADTSGGGSSHRSPSCDVGHHAGVAQQVLTSAMAGSLAETQPLKSGTYLEPRAADARPYQARSP